MSLKKFGQWDVVMRVTQHLAQDIATANKISLSRLAARAEMIAVKHMRDQDLNWKKLSDKYLAYKRRKGLSDKTLISTSTYFQSVTSKADSNTAWAGVTRMARTKDGKQSLANIAKIHEYGSIVQNIPRRPLWRPVFQETLAYLKKEKIFATQAIIQMNKRAGK